MKAADLVGVPQGKEEPRPREGDVELGQKLGDYRRKFRLNQSTVCEHIPGLKRTLLASIEAGHAMPTVRTLIDLADFYEASIDELLAHMRNP